MNANEIVNVLRACGNGNSVCEKCPFYIREDSNECRFNAIYESADTIEAQQQEIDRLKDLVNEQSVLLMEKCTDIEALASDKDEQAGCEICEKGLPCENECDGFCDICDIPEVWKTIHKTGQYNYCPICGKKLGTVPICNTTKLPCAECNPCCEHRAKS